MDLTQHKTLAYTDAGFKKWLEASKHPAYYQTVEEAEILRDYSAQIAKKIKNGATIVDQGAG